MVFSLCESSDCFFYECGHRAPEWRAKNINRIGKQKGGQGTGDSGSMCLGQQGSSRERSKSGGKDLRIFMKMKVP